MPIKVNKPTSTRTTSTSASKTRTTKSTGKEDTPVKVSQMAGGDGFHFTSSRNSKNTGWYLKIKSKANKALNLQTFKVFDFDRADEGIPAALAIGRAG